jgi:hypothetical protein
VGWVLPLDAFARHDSRTCRQLGWENADKPGSSRWQLWEGLPFSDAFRTLIRIQRRLAEV